MKEWELVKMDERFVAWLNDKDIADVVAGLTGNETYLLISNNDSHDTTIDVCTGGIDDAKKMVANIVEHTLEQGYVPHALFDLKAAKEIPFKVITTVTFQ